MNISFSLYRYACMCREAMKNVKNVKNPGFSCSSRFSPLQRTCVRVDIGRAGTLRPGPSGRGVDAGRIEREISPVCQVWKGVN